MKYLFIDRDGTLVCEPEDFQVDRLEKIRLAPDVVASLQKLVAHGYRLVMISNQDGLGTGSFPQADFEACQNFILDIFASQGIRFEDILICPHRPEDACACRKPQVGLVLPYLRRTDWDRDASFVIGDRDTDARLAENMGLAFQRVDSPFAPGLSWPAIASAILGKERKAEVERKSQETAIRMRCNLDAAEPIRIKTGLGFFDHMLDQIGRHGGFSLEIDAEGDLHVDDHHLIEDVAIVLGQCLKKALGDKRGIQRYGFQLPMDESAAECLLDLGGRSAFVWEVPLQRPNIGELSSEMFPHFFRSLADSLGANIHLRARGSNEHHMIEGVFKAFARSLRQALAKEGSTLPSSKGLL